MQLKLDLWMQDIACNTVLLSKLLNESITSVKW